MNMKTLFTILRISYITILFCFALNVQSNNVKIDSDPIIINTDADLDYSNIQFDMSWDNSWRDATNWDAVWVFVKYRVGVGNWQHAYLSTNALNHTVGSNNGVAPAFSVGTTNIAGNDRGMGVFIYRNANGTGNINWDQVSLRWNYGENGVADGAPLTIKVFAIEMCYVPQGNFYAGDGTTTAAYIRGNFHNANNVINPLQITSEASLTLGGVVAGNLGNNNTTGMNPAAMDDFNNVTTQILPLTYPKGYNAFYCMKYEISQEEYVDFLNLLPRTQQALRVQTNVAVGQSATASRYVMSNSVNILKRNSIRCDAAFDPNNPITFYCDFNGNNIGNEAGDAMTIACNYLSWGDLSAYCDWTGLRPMSELEFEKSCRGGIAAVVNEKAWGNTIVNAATGFSNLGQENEIASNNPSNCNAYNSLLPADEQHQGPMRCGTFANGTTNRVQSGATYYGIMEMSGNIVERTINLGTSGGRSFDGLHGNGDIDVNGNADVINWPNVTVGSGIGTRGGNYLDALATDYRYTVSGRYNANQIQLGRTSVLGGRAVRTAP